MIMPEKTTIKIADSKGRVMLGPGFANSTLILKEVDATEVVITKARVVPERELWLLKNPEALQEVLEGLAEVERGECDENPPDFEADLQAARGALREAGMDADA